MSPSGHSSLFRLVTNSDILPKFFQNVCVCDKLYQGKHSLFYLLGFGKIYRQDTVWTNYSQVENGPFPDDFQFTSLWQPISQITEKLPDTWARLLNISTVRSVISDKFHGGHSTSFTFNCMSNYSNCTDLKSWSKLSSLCA